MATTGGVGIDDASLCDHMELQVGNRKHSRVKNFPSTFLWGNGYLLSRAL